MPVKVLNVAVTSGLGYVELEDAQQYMVNQIRSLNAKILKARFELEQIKIAHEAFSSQLIQSVKEAEPEKASG